MTKRVLDVGNCPPDHAAIRHVIEENFNAVVVQAHTLEDTLTMMAQSTFDLVLVNRKLDHDYSDGLQVIVRIKSTPDLANIPVMMVTNFDDHQQQAMRAGAEPGFGKLALHTDETRTRLQRFLT